MTNRLIALGAGLLVAALGASACQGLGPQQKREPAPDATKAVNYAEKADLSTPEGPMYVLLQAAQERNEELFKTAIAPDVNAGMGNEVAFRKFRKKVLTAKVTPVPESVQMVGDNEAIVKLRNARGREIPIRVKNYDGKWLITGIELGAKSRPNMKANGEKKTS
jgi:hypothetical protein